MSRPDRTSESVKPDILSEDVQWLQQMLDSLHGYCNKWSLTVSVDKTKILVSRKGGRLPQTVDDCIMGTN